MKPTEIKKKGVSICLDLPRDSLLSFRRLLFQNGLSYQEFISYLMHMAEFNAEFIQKIMEQAKKAKMEGVNSKGIITNSNVLYDLIEGRSPVKEKVDENDDSK